MSGRQAWKQHPKSTGKSRDSILCRQLPGGHASSPSMILSPKSSSSRAMSHPSPVASGHEIRTSRSLSSWPPWIGLHAT